ASADYYLKHGQMMPDDWFETLKGFDAILFGAVGWPEVVPDHVSLWGSLLKFRREFDQYINLRPVKLMPGVPCPLAGKQPGDIDFLVVRENTEGEYTDVGGRLFAGTDREVVIQENVFTRHGVDRVLDFAFKLAQRRERKHVTSATKSNGIAISMPYWDERVAAVSKNFPDITWDQYHIDIRASRVLLSPVRFVWVVASNLCGVVWSRRGPPCNGSIGIAPSGHLHPGRRFPSWFEPVHGSAPDIYRKNIANPVGMIWSAALMLEFLGEQDPACNSAAKELLTAIETVLEQGPHTPDLGGTSNTTEMGKAIAEALRSEERRRDKERRRRRHNED